MAFDPAVFVDDDGTGYLYAGGGVPGGSNPTQGQWANPKTARVLKLGADMTSVASSASTIDAPLCLKTQGCISITEPITIPIASILAAPILPINHLVKSAI